MLWPPAAATSSARFTFSCPLTSEKSISYLFASLAKISLHQIALKLSGSLKYEAGHMKIPPYRYRPEPYLLLPAYPVSDTQENVTPNQFFSDSL